MKAPKQKPWGEVCRAIGLAAILTIAGCSQSDPASAGKKSASTNAKPVQVVQADDAALETNSVFNDKADTGRDPFFPNSPRRAIPKTGAVAETVVAVKPVLTLNSIVGSANHRIALINNRTLAEGETVMVRVGSGQVRVRCVDIRERSVVVTVEGEPEEKILKLTQ